MIGPQTWPPSQVEPHANVDAMDVDPDLELLDAWRSGDKRAAGNSSIATIG